MGGPPGPQMGPGQMTPEMRVQLLTMIAQKNPQLFQQLMQKMLGPGGMQRNPAAEAGGL
jgi:hypothetical protein